MKTNQNVMVINRPNKEAIEFIRSIQEKKKEVRNSIEKRKEYYFPTKHEVKNNAF